MSIHRETELVEMLQSSLRSDNANVERIGCLSDAEFLDLVRGSSTQGVNLHLATCSSCFERLEKLLRPGLSDA